MVRALLSKSRASVVASEPPAVPPKDKELKASVMNDPTPKENAHADTRGRHMFANAVPLRTLRPLRRSSSRIQQWVQDQQKRLSVDDTPGGNDDVEDSTVTPATASGCDPWLAYPDMRKPSRISVDNRNKENATATGRARDVHEEESLDYVVIDADLSGALRNAPVAQPGTIDLSASPSASVKPRTSGLHVRSSTGTPGSFKGIAAFSFSATARKVSGSDNASPAHNSPNRCMSLFQRVRQSPQRGRDREQRQDEQPGHGQDGQREHARTSSLGSSIFTQRTSHSPASTTRQRESTSISTDTAGPLPTPSSWKLSRASSRLHAHFASSTTAFAHTHVDTDGPLSRQSTSSARTSFDHLGRPSTSTSSSRTASDMLPAPPRPSTSSSRTRATSAGDPFALSLHGGSVSPTTSGAAQKLSFARDRDRERERIGERPPSPASFLSFAPSPHSLWSLPADASHMRDPPGSTKLLASPAPSFTLGSLAIHPRSPSIISGISNRAGSKRKRKLVVSGIAPGDVRKYEQIRRWCEGFGEVNEIVRVPSGDLHVDFRRAEVAETVCRLHARVHINGVGSVGLSWFTGKRP